MEKNGFWDLTALTETDFDSNEVVCHKEGAIKEFFGAFNFSQKTNKNKSTWGITVLKSNFFVRFLGELRLAKSPFEIISPLANQFYSNIFACTYPALCLQTNPKIP